MIYVLFNKGNPVHVTTESPYTGTPALKEFPGVVYDKVKSSHDYKSFEEVDMLAKKLTAMTGNEYLGYDNGDHVSPRFGILVPPKVGDKVSRGFNGDYYPEGEIVKITKGWRVTTSTGVVFNRRKKIRASWVEINGSPFCMVGGHIDERNPSF